MSFHATLPRMSGKRSDDTTAETFFEHSSAARVNTQAVIAASLKQDYPELDQVIVPADNCDLLRYASSTQLSQFEEVTTKNGGKHDRVPNTLTLVKFRPPAHRTQKGDLVEKVLLARYDYVWNGQHFLVYLVDGRDGQGSYPAEHLFYILTDDKAKAHELVRAAGAWTNELHDEVWEFDQGFWQKSRPLYESAQKASWDTVILDPARKKAIIDDHMSFFNSRETYERLHVPWKRGVIYYGPPGNGKTISIKAMMHTLYALKDPIPTLYVRSLVSYAGPEASIRQIFDRARAMAPCYLILEDLDTIITDSVRSYFLNEVDGLKPNDGIFMLGSTNHLDRLDPGISQRPSRFDRKYLFDNPNDDERVSYCHFWQRKLDGNEEIEFPDALCGAIARITNDFSFAYMQEAFVAALLAIARKTDSIIANAAELTLEDEHISEEGWTGVVTTDGDDEDLDKYILWKEIKKQIAILRKALENPEPMH